MTSEKCFNNRTRPTSLPFSLSLSHQRSDRYNNLEKDKEIQTNPSIHTSSRDGLVVEIRTDPSGMRTSSETHNTQWRTKLTGSLCQSNAEKALRENETLKQEVRALKTKIAILKRQNQDHSFDAGYWNQLSDQNVEIAREQKIIIEQLEKRIAKMKGTENIKEEIRKYTSQRADAAKETEETVLRLKAEQEKTSKELEEKIKHCEREVEMAGEDDDES